MRQLINSAWCAFAAKGRWHGGLRLRDGEPLRIATADGLSDAVLVVAAAIALTALVALNLRPRPDTGAELPCPRRLPVPARRPEPPVASRPRVKQKP